MISGEGWQVARQPSSLRWSVAKRLGESLLPRDGVAYGE